MQHYVIKFVSDFLQVSGLFSPGTVVSSTNKTDRHDILVAEIFVESGVKHHNLNPNLLKGFIISHV